MEIYRQSTGESRMDLDGLKALYQAKQRAIAAWQAGLLAIADGADPPPIKTIAHQVGIAQSTVHAAIVRAHNAADRAGPARKD
jgi:hypothetical protein